MSSKLEGKMSAILRNGDLKTVNFNKKSELVGEPKTVAIELFIH